MAGGIVLAPEIIIGVPTIICTAVIGLFTITKLRKQTNILSQQTKILGQYYQPNLVLTDGEMLDPDDIGQYKYILRNDSDIPAYNVKYRFRLIEEIVADTNQISNLMNNFDKVDVPIRSCGVISKGSPKEVFVEVPPKVRDRITYDSYELQQGRKDIKMLLYGTVEYDNLLHPVFMCESFFLDSGIVDSWQMDYPMKPKNFKNTIQQK